MKTNAKTLGVHHVGLTVADIDQTREFFVEVLGFEQVGEKPGYPAVFVSDGSTMLTLWQAESPELANAFDRKGTIGLHHLALRVPNKKSLEALHQQLLGLDDVRIEFAPEPLGATDRHHMMTRIPGGLRVEFISVPAE